MSCSFAVILFCLNSCPGDRAEYSLVAANVSGDPADVEENRPGVNRQKQAEGKILSLE